MVCKQKDGGGGECCAPNSQNGKRKQSRRRARATYLAPSHVSLCHRPADKVTISK